LKAYSYLFGLILFCLFSCTKNNKEETKKDKLFFSSKIDSSLFYYQLGWRQIMDEGNYGPAEVSYRRALQFDPKFQLGKSVLARLTPNLEERLRLFEEIQ